MTDFASLPPEQKIAAEQDFADRLSEIHHMRGILDATLVAFNELRAEAGLAPVTILVPEEQT